jgi:hypothetical protein
MCQKEQFNSIFCNKKKQIFFSYICGINREKQNSLKVNQLDIRWNILNKGKTKTQ